MDVSIVIRTLNEARHLPALLGEIAEQDYGSGAVEVVVVDSGSDDGTVEIAERAGARIVRIRKEDFTFGRSLNVGCEAARGEALVFISGHCIPTRPDWLATLVGELGVDGAAYSYGRQIGDETTRFSERQVFAKFFPPDASAAQGGYFCNNANSALLKSTWAGLKFDEDLTGLEDLALAKRLTEAGGKVAYAPQAAVLHLHDETWRQVRRRYEREALALQHIMPDVHIGWGDFFRFLTSAVFLDFGAALQQRTLMRCASEILMYRSMQFWGSFRGNHLQRKISRRRKFQYFYPA